MEKLVEIRDMMIDIYAGIMVESAAQVSQCDIKEHIFKLGKKFIAELNDKELTTDIMYLNQIELLASVCAKHSALLKDKKDGKI